MVQTWLITGASSGFGSALAEVVLKSGHTVIATARNPVKAGQSHPQMEKLGGHWIQLDVSSPDAQEKVENSIRKIGRIDVLVNAAGYSILGSIEDMNENEIHQQFNTNVYGPIRVMKAALPFMRRQRSGIIVNFSSIVGLVGLPASGIYSASKFALEGLSESLSRELAAFIIRVLLVEPGGFRTNFLAAFVEPAAGLTTDYLGTPLAEVLDYFRSADGKQPGDPAKAAKRIQKVVEGNGMGVGKEDFLRLPLGPDSLQRARAKLESLKINLDQMETIALSTDFEDK
ncbi:hypothetical protein VE00_08119 [Pseudogymnoascus sp. WSF 3629]|nr:hypothetical protein VE00_08119 [Pseudogymnoascus sp. WSF 3629]